MSATLLHASDVTFAYGTDPVLRDVSIELHAGELVAMIGPNGSGKSTLLRALLGHVRAAGSITWDARALSKWPARELARRVGYLPQNPSFDPESWVRDVLRLGRAPYWSAFGIESPTDLHVIDDVARQIGLHNLLDRRIDELSGGQQQRVFVGRCLVQQPAALLLDEPTTFLDLRHQVELLSLLQKLSREQSIGILMASHDLNLVAGFADRMILLDGGAVAATGAPADVMRDELISKVYGVRMERIERTGSAVPVLLPSGH